ncbi:MAG: hypothetical protein KDD98_01295 [Sphingomonadaceae bacterium]|nr:hypothetical protein [Sphingomonadaceae bacterium]
MNRKIRSLLLAAPALCLTPLALAGPAHAQAAQAPAAEPVERLVALFSNDDRNKQLFRKLIDVDMPQALTTDPDIAWLEESCPGAVKAMLQAGEPELWRGFLEDEAEFKQGLIAIFSAYPADHVAGMADFFDSPGGRKLFDNAFANVTYDETLTSIMSSEDGNPSAGALERDRQATERRLRDSMDPSEMADLDYQLRTAPWYGNIKDAMPKVTALRSRIDSAPPVAEEDAKLEKMMFSGLRSHMKSCGIEF